MDSINCVVMVSIQEIINQSKRYSSARVLIKSYDSALNRKSAGKVHEMREAKLKCYSVIKKVSAAHINCDSGEVFLTNEKVLRSDYLLIGVRKSRA